MNASRLSLIALGSLLPIFSARAELTNGLVAYYNFDSEGTAGIANQVDGGLTHNGSYGSGTTYDITPPAGAGAGFAGDAAFPGADSISTTDRSMLLVGKALNVEKNDASATAGSGWFNVPTLSAATLGGNFTVAAWFYLAPDADNTGGVTDVLRDYVFETAEVNNFDVSFGTSDADGNTFVSWVGSTSGAQNAGTLSTGTWHHVVHVFAQSGANTTMSVFIDGVKVGNTASSATTNMNFTSLNFGAARTGIRIFDGMLDEVAVWNRSIATEEVTEIYQRGKAAVALTADLAAIGKAFVNVETSDAVMGHAFGTGVYNLNTQVTVEAAPNDGHVFTDWTSPFSGQADTFDLTVTGPATITAIFDQDTRDTDGDGLNNYQEQVTYRTDHEDPDTDGDQISDFDEVWTTLTDPKVSQLAAVNYIIANLGGGAGPNDTVLTRNQANNTITMKVKAKASATLGSWDTLTPAGTGTVAGHSSGALLLQTPGTADTKRFFQVEGREP